MGIPLRNAKTELRAGDEILRGEALSESKDSSFVKGMVALSPADQQKLIRQFAETMRVKTSPMAQVVELCMEVFQPQRASDLMGKAADFHNWCDVAAFLDAHPGEPVTFTVLRRGKQVRLTFKFEPSQPKG